LEIFLIHFVFWKILFIKKKLTNFFLLKILYQNNENSSPKKSQPLPLAYAKNGKRTQIGKINSWSQ
jgi:hypothetical protein